MSVSRKGPKARPPMLSEPTGDMSETDEDMPARTSPASTRSAAGVEEPGHPDKKWATETRRHRCTRDDIYIYVYIYIAYF